MLVDSFIKSNQNAPKFGIEYLDKKLGGIAKGDLVLIGARSGAGKSTIADNVAIYNSQRGKKVTLISLENFKDENLITKTYYKYKSLTKNYSLKIADFWFGNFSIDKEKLKEAEIWAKDQYANINIVNRNKGYGIEELKQTIIDAAETRETDLIILDHIDYLDKDYSSQSEIEHITNLMKTIREEQYVYKTPFIAISHLRKPLNKEKYIIPSIDEFIGSSNKVKESTCVIMFAPDDKVNTEFPYRETKSTWCCVRKLRRGGIDNTAGRLFFNTRTGTYSPDYEEYSIDYAGTELKKKERY